MPQRPSASTRAGFTLVTYRVPAARARGDALDPVHRGDVRERRGRGARARRALCACGDERAWRAWLGGLALDEAALLPLTDEGARRRRAVQDRGAAHAPRAPPATRTCGCPAGDVRSCSRAPARPPGEPCARCASWWTRSRSCRPRCWTGTCGRRLLAMDPGRVRRPRAVARDPRRSRRARDRPDHRRGGEDRAPRGAPLRAGDAGGGPANGPARPAGARP